MTATISACVLAAAIAGMAAVGIWAARAARRQRWLYQRIGMAPRRHEE
jgi:hypothetical protein